jgi:oligopeptide/dipeptide ABC transporter ATP-binding protein
MIVEEGTRRELLSHPRHPYAQGLLKSIPAPRRAATNLQEIKGVVPRPGRWRRAAASRRAARPPSIAAKPN